MGHPRKDGSTAQANTFPTATTQLTLTDTNLETARISVMRQLDDRGKPTRSGSGKLVLVVPPELEKTAIIITKSEKRSGTARLLALCNRIKDVVLSYNNITSIVCNHLTFRTSLA